MFEYISLHYNNNIYIIMKEPYETIENTYKRAWFIVKNYDKFQDYNKLYSFSILYENIIKAFDKSISIPEKYLSWKALF